tara:strand:+ start:48539 stop:48769 length:231 start_codon:yes stop_codon:yes gene_type:complete
MNSTKKSFWQLNKDLFLTTLAEEEAKLKKEPCPESFASLPSLAFAGGGVSSSWQGLNFQYPSTQSYLSLKTALLND